MDIPQGYKQTELGIIPEDWEIVRLKDIGDFSKGAGISREDAQTGNIPAIRYGEIYTSHNYCIRTFYSYIDIVVAQHAKKLSYGDILFACSGETKEDIGKSVAYINDIIAYAGGDIIILSPDQSCYDSRFMGYATNAAYVVSQKSAKGQGDAIVHISKDSLAEIMLYIPRNKKEQQAIAEALSDIDGLIAALDKKIAKKRLIKQGAMSKLLSLSNRGNKWFNTKLGSVVNIRKGSMLTSEEFIVGNVPVIAGGKTPAGYHNVANRPANTITISASGASAGYVALHNTPIFASDCSTIVPDPSYDIKYIYHLLVYYQSEIYSLQTGGAQPHVHPSDLNEMQILYASDH